MMEHIADTVSTRDPVRITQAARGGADIATIPSQVLHHMAERQRQFGPTERSPRLGISHRTDPHIAGRPTQSRIPIARQS
jgi:hypothetical protein